MKNISITLLLMLSSFVIVSAQSIVKEYKPNAKVLSDGNYQEIKTTIENEESDSTTGKLFTDVKGVIYPVYKTSKDKLYIVKVSKKTDKLYRKYLKL